jgi:CheY-like chemotaxis protein
MQINSRKGQLAHILAINNDQAVLNLFHDLLTEEGYRVNTQAYVDKDLAEVARLAPDLIILDYMWADEDGGWSMLQMLQMDPKTAKIPIILCTGAVREVTALSASTNYLTPSLTCSPPQPTPPTEPIHPAEAKGYAVDNHCDTPAYRAHRELVHELRTPLTVLMGRVQLMRRRRLLGREPFCQDGELEAIEAAIIRLAAAVERVDRTG